MIDVALGLPCVQTTVGYIAEDEACARYRIYGPLTGRKDEAPKITPVSVEIYDAREISDQLHIDEVGFQLVRHESMVKDYFDSELVKDMYYPEIEALLVKNLSAERVVVFDHNVRSARGADAGRSGVRTPVGDVHNDYSEISGARRIEHTLQSIGERYESSRRMALINVWRPLHGPVKDRPLALCDTRSVSRSDFVEVDIEHFSDDDLTTPNHSGQIYSLHYNKRHRWFYFSDMMPAETLVFKCFDTRTRGIPRFTPHTAFLNPNCPSTFVPRESIEARTLVIFPR